MKQGITQRYHRSKVGHPLAKSWESTLNMVKKDLTEKENQC